MSLFLTLLPERIRHKQLHLVQLLLTAKGRFGCQWVMARNTWQMNRGPCSGYRSLQLAGPAGGQIQAITVFWPMTKFPVRAFFPLVCRIRGGCARSVQR